jgi:hypothetical protein
MQPIIRPHSASSRRRCLATLGGTTTLADCLVALRHLADPRVLIRVIDESAPVRR